MNLPNFLQNIFRSRKFKIVAVALGSIVVALVIFRAGMLVGFYKASFSYGWDEHNRQMFDRDGRHSPRNFFGDEGFTAAHGVSGTIVKIDSGVLMVIGRDNIEKEVLTNDQTLFRRFRDAVRINDLKVGDQVVVVGAPDAKARIEARLIRIFPEAASSTPITTPK